MGDSLKIKYVGGIFTWKKNINKEINELLIIYIKKKTGEENVKVREEKKECVLISKYKVLNFFFMYSSFLLYYLT